MSKIEVDQLDPQSGTNLTIGTSGDTIKTGTGTSLVVQGDGSSANGLITLNCSQNSHGVKISSPDHSGGQSYTMKLPATNITAGKFLKVDSITGSGATAVGQLSFADEPGGGKINQVVSTTKTDTWSSSGTGNFQAVTGLSVAITPSATSSKVYVNVDLTGYFNDYGGGFSIYRDGSAIVAPTSPSSRSIVNAGQHTPSIHYTSAFGHSYLDSPSSTSALTYQVYVFARSGNYYINRSNQDSDTNDYVRTVSTITAFEVLA